MNWSRETLNADFSHVKCCLPGINERVFCIVTGDEKWIHYDNPKKRKLWEPLDHVLTLTAKPNKSWKKTHFVYLVGSAWCRELLKPNETITGALYRTQLMRLSREKTCTTIPGMTKLFSCMIMLDYMLRRQSKPT